MMSNALQDSRENEKNKRYLNALYWMYIREDLYDKLSRYFEKKNFKEIAIYGMGQMGELLAKYLKDIGVLVQYGIDKNADYIYSDIEVVYLEDIQSGPDLVIVTPIMDYEIISCVIREKLKCEVISLEDIAYM